MASADKRAKLLSDLLAAKGVDTGPAELERAAVIPIAKRRPGDEHESEVPAAPSALYSKGAATASTFRPSYWSFDHNQAEAEPAPAKAEPAPPPAPTLAAPAAGVSKSRPLPINFVVAFGCVALLVSTTLFVLSQRGVEMPAAPQTPSTIAAAAPMPATAPVAPLPPALAEPVAAVPPPVPNPRPGASAPPAAVGTAPTPAAATPPSPVASTPAPVVSDPLPVIAEPAAKAAGPADSASVAASAPAPGPAPSAGTQQVDALLARGDDLLATGDVAAARLFYQRAAELGSAAAATAVGQTYDPGVLELLRVRGTRGDAQMATEWYRKAIAAGDRQAEIRLKRLLARASG